MIERKMKARTRADVVPIGVIRRELLERASFHKVNPCWNLEFSGAFKMGGVGGDERICATKTQEMV